MCAVSLLAPFYKLCLRWHSLKRMHRNKNSNLPSTFTARFLFLDTSTLLVYANGKMMSHKCMNQRCKCIVFVFFFICKFHYNSDNGLYRSNANWIKNHFKLMKTFTLLTQSVFPSKNVLLYSNFDGSDFEIGTVFYRNNYFSSNLFVWWWMLVNLRINRKQNIMMFYSPQNSEMIFCFSFSPLFNCKHNINQRGCCCVTINSDKMRMKKNNLAEF